MIPIRCLSCNKVLAQYYDEIEEFRKNSKIPNLTFFEDKKITRYCCKKILLTYVDIYKQSMIRLVNNNYYECIENIEIPVIFPVK